MSGTVAPFEDPVVEALARQTECRWRTGLALLRRVDAGLADRVVRRLLTAVDFGGGVVVPAFPDDQADLERLVGEMCNGDLAPGQRAERARGWLDTLPRATAWVIDDAGLRDAASGGALATLGIASLSEQSTLSWAQDAHAGPPDLTPLAAGGVRQIQAVVGAVAAAADRGDKDALPARPGARRLATVVAHAGAWKTSLPVAAAPLSASPPGLHLGPLVPDWSMDAWVVGASGVLQADQAWATMALLHRAAVTDGGRADDNAPPAAGPTVWSLFIECRSAAPGPEAVRIWLGAFGSPVAVLRISSDGAVVDERTPGQGSPLGVHVIHESGRWIFQIPIPARAIDGASLRLSLERTDSRGRRTAWPRPMLPWQTEPGRAAVDLSGWRTVGDADGADGPGR